MERNCQKCIHHISGSCCKWDCEMQTLEDYRNKVIDEFAETLNKKISEFVLEHKDNLDFASGISVAWNMVDEIAEQMKGGV